MMTSQPDHVLQACNAAAQLTQVNFTNSIASNFRPRTKRFIRLELGQIAHFTQMPAARVTSWVNLLYRAASEDSNVWQLLPIYTTCSTTRSCLGAPRVHGDYMASTNGSSASHRPDIEAPA